MKIEDSVKKYEHVSKNKNLKELSQQFTLVGGQWHPK